MSIETLLIILLIGAIAGWLAGQIVQGTGFGLIADIVIGIIGAFIGNWLLPRLGIHLGVGIVAAIIAATVGAVVLLALLSFFGRSGVCSPKRRRWRRALPSHVAHGSYFYYFVGACCRRTAGTLRRH